MRLLSQLIEKLGLSLTKPRLPLYLKDERDTCARTLYQFMVTILEGEFQAASDVSTDGTLAGAHEAN